MILGFGVSNGIEMYIQDKQEALLKNLVKQLTALLQNYQRVLL